MASGAVEKAKAAREASKAATTKQVLKNAGRRGKQARLRALANDTKISRSIRGQLKNDIRHIQQKHIRVKRIRVPKGYNLAHRRGFEARKGYDYSYTVLQYVSNHILQHRYDHYGRR